MTDQILMHLGHTSFDSQNKQWRQQQQQETLQIQQNNSIVQPQQKIGKVHIQDMEDNRFNNTLSRIEMSPTTLSQGGVGSPLPYDNTMSAFGGMSNAGMSILSSPAPRMQSPQVIHEPI